MIPNFWQPHLSGTKASCIPLTGDDFEVLYGVASDPDVWTQHPNKNRYKREVFMNFFDGAIASQGALKIIDNESGKVIGGTRFYDYDEEQRSVFIGYTFYGVTWWGKGYNAEVKHLMLSHAFQLVDKVYFHVGIDNHRSIRAMSKLGSIQMGTLDVAYHGESIKTNVEYLITKSQYHSTE